MRLRSLGSIALVLAMATAAMAAEDPYAGTWKLNVAKSRFAPGQVRKSEVNVIEIQGNLLKIVGDRVDADGKATHRESDC